MCRLVVVMGAFVACAWLAGCAAPEPVLHPVSGSVQFPDGKPAKACSVEFTSQAEATKGLQASAVHN